MDNNQMNAVAPVTEPNIQAPVANNGQQPNGEEKKESKLTNKKIVLDEDPIYVDVQLDDEESVSNIAPSISGSPTPGSSSAPQAEEEKPAVQTGNITF